MTDMLTPREVLVLKYLSMGMLRKQVAREMDITISAVALASEQGRLKLRAHNTPHAVRIAMEQGIIQ